MKECHVTLQHSSCFNCCWLRTQRWSSHTLAFGILIFSAPMALLSTHVGHSLPWSHLLHLSLTATPSFSDHHLLPFQLISCSILTPTTHWDYLSIDPHPQMFSNSANPTANYYIYLQLPCPEVTSSHCLIKHIRSSSPPLHACTFVAELGWRNIHNHVECFHSIHGHKPPVDP